MCAGFEVAEPSGHSIVVNQAGSWTLLAVVAGLALGVSPILADGPSTGAIDGRVTDLQGTPLAGVTVTLTGTPSRRTATETATVLLVIDTGPFELLCQHLLTTRSATSRPRCATREEW